MNRILTAAIILVPVLGWAQTQNNTYTLKGKFKSAVNGKIYLQYNKDGKIQKDSTTVRDGAFEMKGAADGPQQVYMSFISNDGAADKKLRGRDSKSIYLDRGLIRVDAQDSIKTAKISGAGINAENEKYQAVLSASESLSNKLRKEYYALTPEQRKDKLITGPIEEKMDQAEEAGKAALREYVKQNPDSYFSLQALQKIAGAYFDADKVEPLFKKLSPGLRSSKDGVAFAAAMEATRSTAVGKIAPEFTQLDTENKPVKLSDFRGKFVLIDFWASWCGPCRAENPKVLKAYNAYKDKNFTVLGVSLDQEKDRDKWLKAIKDDGMPWTQVVDPNHDDKKGAGNLYAIKAIPSNFLLDPQGKIIAKNLRGEALEKKLAEVIK